MPEVVVSAQGSYGKANCDNMHPFVFINAAMSADGKISTHLRKQVRISGDRDFHRVDRLRCETDAIMVGIGTILSDDPSLTVKSEEFQRMRLDSGRDENPVRVVIDSLAKTPPNADILRKGAGRRIIFVTGSATSERVDALSTSGAEVVVAGGQDGARVDLAAALGHLHGTGIRRLMVEGGATLNWSLIERGLVDEIYVYIGSLVLGGSVAPTLVDGAGFSNRDDAPLLDLISIDRMDDGFVVKWRVLR
ncbi:MAG: 2,5-diamino-6-(ribosylamino)-4(3H)-pyrimidinone 5'-phosphate reductase [Euryarchaeota archaeon]|nr:2,5-diamino-6-(ribosylamino)-4(3H)-pyrimidinone 5'-phosphate reductase [Euryarchaeota archaeon]